MVLLIRPIKRQSKRNNSIRLQDVKDYLHDRQDIQVKVTLKTYNWFVYPGANFELEIEIMDIEAQGVASNACYGLVAIDGFSKIAEVVPIKNRTPEETIAGLKKIFESMGKPKQLYSDEESSMRSSQMNKFIHDSETKSIQTTAHAHTIERFARTFKDDLHRILDSLNQDKSECIKHIDNNMKNIITQDILQFIPDEAIKKENHLWVSWHLQISAKMNRKHPETKKGDMVRFKLKPSMGTKPHEPKWYSTKHRIPAIKDGQYLYPKYK